MWANPSGCSPKMSNVSESLRLLTKISDVSKSLRLLTKNEQMNKSLVFMSKWLIRSFFCKKRASCSVNLWANSQPCHLHKVVWTHLHKHDWPEHTYTCKWLVGTLIGRNNTTYCTHNWSEHFYQQMIGLNTPTYTILYSVHMVVWKPTQSSVWDYQKVFSVDSGYCTLGWSVEFFFDRTEQVN